VEVISPSSSGSVSSSTLGTTSIFSKLAPMALAAISPSLSSSVFTSSAFCFSKISLAAF
jgi:hypothetical protein